MIRLIIKVAIAALIANAAWRVGSVHVSYYKFKDAVHETMQFGGEKSEDQLRQRILDLASQYDQPVTEDNFTVRRDEAHIYADGAFKRPIQLVPGYTYQWPFNWHVEVLNIDLKKPI